MAYEDIDEMDDGVFEEEVDNARALTSGIVITTSICLLLACIVVFYALDKYFQVGPMAK
ncbi:MAG: hypothetical protein H6807_17380 [Planctomycetes bacterium]|nr:hypothetical protein [Planctomycetota bacterium]